MNYKLLELLNNNKFVTSIAFENSRVIWENSRWERLEKTVEDILKTIIANISMLFDT